MSIIRNLRASEQFGLIGENRKDFVIRKSGLTTRQKYEMIVTVPVIVVSVEFLVDNNLGVGSAICIVVGLIMFILGREIEKYRRMLQATEFMNALFATALGAGWDFCAVAKQDGDIVYLSRSFQSFFPEMTAVPKRTLRVLFDLYHAPDTAAQTIMETIKVVTKSEHTVQMEMGKERQLRSVVITVEPISSPSGYVLLRGHA